MIPKIIHCAWFSGEEKPPEIKRCMDSWSVFAKDFEIKEWNADTFPWNDFDWPREAFQKRKWAFMTDFFRLWVLAQHGGVYMDCDVELNAPLAPVVETDLFVGMETLGYEVGAHIIGSVAGHPFIERLLAEYSCRHFITDGVMDQTPMPVVFSRAFREMFGSYQPTLPESSVRVYSDNLMTLNALDGRNIAAHRMCGSWMDAAARLPMEYQSLRLFFWNTYIDHGLEIGLSLADRSTQGKIKIVLWHLLKQVIPYALMLRIIRRMQKHGKPIVP